MDVAQTQLLSSNQKADNSISSAFTYLSVLNPMWCPAVSVIIENKNTAYCK